MVLKLVQKESIPTGECTKRILSMFLSLIVFFLSGFMLTFTMMPFEDPVYFVYVTLSGLSYGSFFLVAAVSFFMGPTMVIRKRVLTEVPDNHSFRPLLEKCSTYIGLKETPKCLFSDYPTDTCFIFGRTNRNTQLVIGQSFWQFTNRSSLKAVILHELAHLKNRDVAFMTWSVAFTQALKYWFIFVIASTGIMVIYLNFSFHQIVASMLPSLIFLYAFFWISPVLTFNSISRIRECLADAQASLVLEGTSLVSSAIKEAASFQILQGLFQRRPYSKNMFTKLKSFIGLNWIPNYLSKYIVSSHPLVRERLRLLEKGRFVNSRVKPYIPTFESAVFTGYISFLFIFSIIMLFMLFVFTMPIAMQILEITLATILLLAPGLLISFLNSPGYLRTPQNGLKYVKSMIARNLVSIIVFTIAYGVMLLPRLGELPIALFVGLFVLSLFVSMAVLLFLWKPARKHK